MQKITLICLNLLDLVQWMTSSSTVVPANILEKNKVEIGEEKTEEEALEELKRNSQTK